MKTRDKNQTYPGHSGKVLVYSRPVRNRPKILLPVPVVGLRAKLSLAVRAPRSVFFRASEKHLWVRLVGKSILCRTATCLLSEELPRLGSFWNLYSMATYILRLILETTTLSVTEAYTLLSYYCHVTHMTTTANSSNSPFHSYLFSFTLQCFGTWMWGNFGQFCSFCPKLPHIRVKNTL